MSRVFILKMFLPRIPKIAKLIRIFNIRVRKDVGRQSHCSSLKSNQSQTEVRERGVGRKKEKWEESKDIELFLFDILQLKIGMMSKLLF